MIYNYNYNYNLLSRYNIILLNKKQKQRLKQNPDNKSGLSTHLKRHNDADTLQSKKSNHKRQVLSNVSKAIEFIEVGEINADVSPAFEARSSPILDSDHCAILACILTDRPS